MSTKENVLCKVYENHSQDTRYKELGDVCQTVSATYGMGGNNQPLVVSGVEDMESKETTVYRGDSITCPTNASNPKPGDACHTLTDDNRNYLVEMVMENNVNILNPGDSQGNQVADANGAYPALRGCGGAGYQQGYLKSEEPQTVVRRLTPLECERLQGYPDGWTDIGEWVDSKGKKHKPADSPRYKALGNSIGLPFWQWMMDRIAAQLKEDGVEKPTMGSLFDGIGGFPLVSQRAGIKPIWASEIEEFPIAVTKRRFPEESEHEETNNQLAVSDHDPDSEKRGQLF